MSDIEADPVAALAEEIRSAVAETNPSGPGDESARRVEALEAVRAPLARAQAHVTPSVAEGARLAGVKALAVRVLRFLWRDQAAFNALTLDAQKELTAKLEEVMAEHEAERRRREARDQAIEAAARRRAAIQDGRLSRLEAPAARPPAPGAPAAPAAARESEIPPGVYALFEDRFRGDPAAVAEKQRSYVAHLAGLPGPVLDVGCGRGDFLSLLAAAGIPASGVETNVAAAGLGREAGLAIEEGDGIAALERRKAGSLGAVVAIQVVEHWTAGATWTFLRAARNALAPGGVLLLETINTDSLSALRAFFLDPTHVRPVPAAALAFLAEAAGFVEARIEWKAPLPPSERLAETGANDALLNRLLFGPQDYALIARVPDKN